MNVPIIMLVGSAGVGKDTIANQMVVYGGAAIAQADPLKRFASKIFGFTDEQLWGPSELRNIETDNKADMNAWYSFATYWLQDIGISDKLGSEQSMKLLKLWRDKHISGRELSPRHVLQTLGTEFGRAAWPEVWVHYAQNMALKLLITGGGYSRSTGFVDGVVRPNFVVISDGRFANEIIATKHNGGMVIKIIDPTPRHLQGSAGQHASELEQNSIPDAWYDLIIENNKVDGKEKLAYLIDSVMHTYIMGEPRHVGTHSYRP